MVAPVDTAENPGCGFNWITPVLPVLPKTAFACGSCMITEVKIKVVPAIADTVELPVPTK